MSGRYLLAPEAANELVQIWRYIKKQSSVDMADRVEAVILDKDCLSGRKSWRGTLAQKSDRSVGEILPVYSYLIVYRPDTKPL